MTRRDFLSLIAAAGSAIALPSLIAGCATDPVTGKKTLVGLSEEGEINVDKKKAPHQKGIDCSSRSVSQRINQRTSDTRRASC